MKKITPLLMSILLLLSACGQAPIAAETGTIPKAAQEQKEAPMIPTKVQTADEDIEAEDNTKAAKAAERVDVPKSADKTAEKQAASAEVGRPAVSEPPAASKPEAKPASEPTPTPTPTLRQLPLPNPRLNLHLRPTLTLRRLRPAGTSTPWRRRCRRATSTRKRSMA